MRRTPGPKIALSDRALSYLAEYHQRPRDHLLYLCINIWLSHAQKKRPPGISGGLEKRIPPTVYPWGPPGRGLALRAVGDVAPSHLERGLNPARLGLPLGVFRRFGTMACLSRRRLA